MKISQGECKNILIEIIGGQVSEEMINEYLDDIFKNPPASNYLSHEKIGLERFVLRTFKKWFYK